AAGLDTPDARASLLGQRADAVDRAVDDADVKPPQRASHPTTDAHEDQVVEIVEPPLVPRSVVERLQALRDALDESVLLLGPEEAEQEPGQADAEGGNRDAADDQRAVDARKLERLLDDAQVLGGAGEDWL